MAKLDRVEGRTQIKVLGKIKLGDIIFSYIPQMLEFSKEERSYIESEWSRQTKLKPFLFDGRIIHIQEQRFHNSTIAYSMCDSSYKEYIATNTKGFKKLFDKKRVVRPLSVGTMIVTADDKWIIGKRLNTFDSEGLYTLVAGYMDPTKDIVNSKPDPFFAMRREIKEETGVSDTHIANSLCIGIVDQGQPYLAFSTSVTNCSDDLISKNPSEKEFSSLQCYDLKKNVIEEFLLNNYEKTTANATGNILIFYYLHLYIEDNV